LHHGGGLKKRHSPSRIDTVPGHLEQAVVIPGNNYTLDVTH